MHPLLEGIDHVVWDWNGTLLDDAWLCVEVMNGLLSRRRLPPLSPERYAEVFRFPVRDYYRSLGFDFEAEPWETVGTEFIDGYEARHGACELRPDAPAVLSALEATGRTQSVLSASEQARLHAQARRLGVDGRFETLVGLSDHYAGGKIDLGRSWLGGRGLAPDRVLLVGDTDHDVAVARALGLRCALVPSGHQSEARLRALGAPVLPDLSALLGGRP